MEDWFTLCAAGPPPRVCLRAHTSSWKPNKAEIDGVLAGESFLMVADIQLQKILHWMWEKVKTKGERVKKIRKKMENRMKAYLTIEPSQ